MAGQGIKTDENEKPIKMSAEKACELQALHGTVEGSLKFPEDPYWTALPNNEPTFVLDELLELGQMKQYFGSTLLKLEETHRKYHERDLNGAIPRQPRPAAMVRVQTTHLSNGNPRTSQTREAKYINYWKEQGITAEEIPKLLELSKISITEMKKQLQGITIRSSDCNKEKLTIMLYMSIKAHNDEADVGLLLALQQFVASCDMETQSDAGDALLLDGPIDSIDDHANAAILECYNIWESSNVEDDDDNFYREEMYAIDEEVDDIEEDDNLYLYNDDAIILEEGDFGNLDDLDDFDDFGDCHDDSSSSR